jgi:hypothetical protein
LDSRQQKQKRLKGGANGSAWVNFRKGTAQRGCTLLLKPHVTNVLRLRTSRTEKIET